MTRETGDAREDRCCACIDLKSFYASVECAERGLDPMTARLVVADPERTDKTICLAVSPALKAQGVPGRCRVFEIPPGLSYITAPPRMQLYIDYSARIYRIYLHYFSKEDIHVYSIDEVFLDMTRYASLYRESGRAIVKQVLSDIKKETGIPAAAGIGTNLYLAKIALDIIAKHTGDFIGELNETAYCEKLWDHRPITDFWRIGKGIAGQLSRLGITTMGEVAAADAHILYRTFGIDAELLIDHAWGREPVTMADIKAYKPRTNSLSSGQVLFRDYQYEEGRLIVSEMADALALELAQKEMVTDSLTLHVSYSRRYAKKSAHGTVSFPDNTDFAGEIIDGAVGLYEQIMDPSVPIRRVTLTLNHVTKEEYRQYSLFSDPGKTDRDQRMQRAVLEIKTRFGKNALMRGRDLLEEATAMERNRQIGGHKSGT